MLSIALNSNHTSGLLSPNKQVNEFINHWLTDPDPFFSNENDFFKNYSSTIKLFEKESKYIIQFPVPGYNRNNLKLELQENRLLVRAKASMQHSQSESSLLHSFTLPEDADSSRIKAQCQNGLLEVKIKKYTSARKVKVIPVKSTEDRSIPKGSFFQAIKNKLKRILPAKKRNKSKLPRQSWLKAVHDQRLRLRKIPHSLLSAMKGRELSMIVFLQALFVLIVALLAGTFFIMHLLDQQSMGA